MSHLRNMCLWMISHFTNWKSLPEFHTDSLQKYKIRQISGARSWPGTSSPSRRWLSSSKAGRSLPGLEVTGSTAPLRAAPRRPDLGVSGLSVMSDICAEGDVGWSWKGLKITICKIAPIIRRIDVWSSWSYGQVSALFSSVTVSRSCSDISGKSPLWQIFEDSTAEHSYDWQWNNSVYIGL